MTDFSHLLQNGASHAWVFVPTAILLGALHGLEPGHSKTMMAAFIIAVRGTVAQAILLGLSAAFSHSLIIWLLAAVALRFGSHWNAESTEPYFQLASAVLILAMALWMFLRTQRDLHAAHDHDHGHDHGHGHDHSHDAPVRIATPEGPIELTVFEDGVPPVFRLAFPGQAPEAASVRIETLRPEGTRQSFAFERQAGGLLESTSPIPEPHEFTFTLHTARGSFEAALSEHAHEGDGEFEDAHEAAHALDIQKRFANREVTTGQIVLFGLTGGLLPCPAAFTVLIVCLQLKEFTLGFALVGAFSLGLALTMVSVGALAAWSLRRAEKKFTGFGPLMRKAPYLSCALLVVLALFMAFQAWRALAPA